VVKSFLSAKKHKCSAVILHIEKIHNNCSLFISFRNKIGLVPNNACRFCSWLSVYKWNFNTIQRSHYALYKVNYNKIRFMGLLVILQDFIWQLTLQYTQSHIRDATAPPTGR